MGAIGIHVEFRILGPVGVRYDGRDLLLGGKKPLTLLAALLMNRGAAVHDSRLIEFLWGSNPPKTVDAQLYTYVSRLRKQLSSAAEFARRGEGYAMSTGRVSFDYEVFQRLFDLGAEELGAARYQQASNYLARALEMWSGPALTNVTEFFSDEQAAGLEERRLTALEYKIEADLALGRESQVLSDLYVLTARHPMREIFRDQLMRALFRCGRQAEAIKIYHDGRRLLADELGVDPDHALQRTYRAILAGDLRLRFAGAGGAPEENPR
jgi:DNA-binding SARP family transcriptional activator